MNTSIGRFVVLILSPSDKLGEKNVIKLKNYAVSTFGKPVL